MNDDHGRGDDIEVLGFESMNRTASAVVESFGLPADAAPDVLAAIFDPLPPSKLPSQEGRRLARTLREAAQSSRVSYAALAERVGVDEDDVYLLLEECLGDDEIDRDLVSRVAETLGVKQASLGTLAAWRSDDEGMPAARLSQDERIVPFPAPRYRFRLSVPAALAAAGEGPTVLTGAPPGLHAELRWPTKDRRLVVQLAISVIGWEALALDPVQPVEVSVSTTGPAPDNVSWLGWVVQGATSTVIEPGLTEALIPLTSAVEGLTDEQVKAIMRWLAAAVTLEVNQAGDDEKDA